MDPPERFRDCGAFSIIVGIMQEKEGIVKEIVPERKNEAPPSGSLPPVPALVWGEASLPGDPGKERGVGNCTVTVRVL